MRDTLEHQELPNAFQKDVMDYYRYNFRTCGRIGGTQENPLQDLPVDLMRKVDSAIGASILQRVPIFKEACQNQNFLSKIVQKMESRALVPGTVVFHRGAVGDSMYFVVSGEVAVLDEHGKEVCLSGSIWQQEAHDSSRLVVGNRRRWSEKRQRGSNAAS